MEREHQEEVGFQLTNQEEVDRETRGADGGRESLSVWTPITCIVCGKHNIIIIHEIFYTNWWMITLYR